MMSAVGNDGAVHLLNHPVEGSNVRKEGINMFLFPCAEEAAIIQLYMHVFAY